MTTWQWFEWEFQRDVLFFFFKSIMCASFFFKAFHGYLGEEAMGNNRALEEEQEEQEDEEEGNMYVEQWADGDVIIVFCDGDTMPLE